MGIRYRRVALYLEFQMGIIYKLKAKNILYACSALFSSTFFKIPKFSTFNLKRFGFYYLPMHIV